MKVSIGDTIKIKSRAELYNLASDSGSIVINDMLEYADCILTIEPANISLDYVFYENWYWPINSYDIYQGIEIDHDELMDLFV